MITGTGHNPEQQKNNFYSKAIAAYTLVHEAGATPEQAVAASIDGGGDHGIDSVYVSPDDTLWLVQSKYISSGWGEPELGDVSKFQDGTSDLIQGHFERFRTLPETLLPDIRRVLDSPVGKVQLILAHTGHALSDDRRHIFGELERSFSGTNPGFLKWSSQGLSILHGHFLDTLAVEPIEEEITLQDFGYLQRPYKAFYGRLSAQRIAELYLAHKANLVEKNIRRFKGSTSVNEGLASTLRTEPEHLFYFNNGVTFLCDSIHEIGQRDPNRQLGRFRVRGLSIINGAQTAGSIAQQTPDYYAENPAEVLATFIALDNSPDDFAAQVTEYRNRQNAVNLEDFTALHEQQDHWCKTLESAGITYLFKSGYDDPPTSDTVFNIKEAAPALACCNVDTQRNDSDISWVDFVIASKCDQTRLYQQPELVRKKTKMADAYQRIFPDSLTARELWRTVQISRFVQKTLTDRAKSEEYPRKEILQQGKWLALHVILLKTRLRYDSNLNLDADEINRLSQAVDKVAEELITQTQALNFQKQYRSVFENKADCQSIKTSMMRVLGPMTL
ncbi:MAG: AIPR family protein [Thiolinea sp.]